MTTVLVNGQPRTVADGATLADVVAQLSDRPTGVAAAVDDEGVPRSGWASTVLVDGARVEVLTAVQGG